MKPTPAKDLLTQHNLQTSHWGQRIIAAEERGGKFTEEDANDSYDWTTCACGKQDPRGLIQRIEFNDSVSAVHRKSDMIYGIKSGCHERYL